MVVLARAERVAIGLNLFHNYKRDDRRFTPLEVGYTYLYIVAFTAATVVMVLQLVGSAQLWYHCDDTPHYDDICPATFSLCTCPTIGLIADLCNQTTSPPLAGCTCCWYNALDIKGGVLLFATQMGGLYTFSMGVSIAFLAVVRRVAVPPECPSGADGVSIELNAVVQHRTAGSGHVAPPTTERVVDL